MAATPPQPSVQDFATESGIVQSPRNSLDSSSSFVYLHATCRKCFHWYNKHKIPNPFPRHQNFDLKCPNCHKKLFRVGTQSSQDSFMTQETDILSSRAPSLDIASIQRVLNSDSRSSSRIRPRTRRAQTEPALDTVIAEPIDDEEQEDVTPEHLDNPDGHPAEMRSEPQIDLLGIDPDRGSTSVSNQPVQDLDGAYPMDEIRLEEESPPPISTSINEASDLRTRRHGLSKEKVKLLPRKISTFVKNKVRRLLSLGTRRRTIPDAQFSDTSATTVPAGGTVGEISFEAFGAHEAAGPQEAAPPSDVAVQTANATTAQLPGLAVPSTGATRRRSRSAPSEIIQPPEGSPTALTKDEYRRKLREEKTRQARERELERRRCPCWTQCECYPDGPRRRLERSQTMPNRPLICGSFVRDERNDELFREVLHLAQQARARRAEAQEAGGSSNDTNQAGPLAGLTPSQAPTWDSHATTLSGIPLSNESMASTQGESVLLSGVATHPLINTDLNTELLGSEDDHTPRQTDYVDEGLLLHLGGQYDDRNNENTDGANQRN